MPETLNAFPSEPKVTQTPTLNNRQVRITSRWFERLRAWFADVTELDETQGIAYMRRLSPGSPTVRDINTSGIAGGAIITQGPDEYVREAFGGELTWDYFAPDEIREAAPDEYKPTVTLSPPI